VMSISMKTNYSETSTAVITSTDGGLTWKVAGTQNCSSDPDVTYTNFGTAFWSFLDETQNNAIGIRSANGGGTFGTAITDIGKAVDHPMMTVDRGASSDYWNTIYNAARSLTSVGLSTGLKPNGKPWINLLVPLSSSGTNLARGFVWGPAVMNDGTLLIPMSTAINTIITPGGTWGGDTQDLYVLKSTDGGLTYSAIFVAHDNSPANPGNGGDGLGGSNLAVGPGPGASGQRVYLSYTAYLENAPCAFMLTMSDDEGKTWSTPRQIPMSLPNNEGPGPTTLMMSPQGVLGVQFFGTTATNFDVYFMSSTDEGSTFSSPVAVNSVRSNEPNYQEQPRPPGQDQTYGDVDSNGVFHVVWSDGRGNATNYTTYTRSVTVK